MKKTAVYHNSDQRNRRHYHSSVLYQLKIGDKLPDRSRTVSMIQTKHNSSLCET